LSGEEMYMGRNGNFVRIQWEWDKNEGNQWTGTENNWMNENDCT